MKRFARFCELVFGEALYRTLRDLFCISLLFVLSIATPGLIGVSMEYWLGMSPMPSPSGISFASYWVLGCLGLAAVFIAGTILFWIARGVLWLRLKWIEAGEQTSTT